MEKLNNIENLQDVKTESPLLKNRIDFVVLVGVTDANPNGDPNYGNRPRSDYDGYGQISDVCLKRKIRNRMKNLGEEIFYDIESGIPTQEKLEQFKSISTTDELRKAVCEKWADVRAFGATLTAGKGFKIQSLGIKGPVSFCLARSIDPVDIVSMGITCGVNREKKDGLDSNRMGEKHLVRFGLYEVKGSVSVQSAQLTGFSYSDAKMLKHCLQTLFVNDESAARPAGSLEVVRVFWWEHNGNGQVSPATVHRSVHVKLKDGVDKPVSADSYEIIRDEIPGLPCEEVAGL